MPRAIKAKPAAAPADLSPTKRLKLAQKEFEDAHAQDSRAQLVKQASIDSNVSLNGSLGLDHELSQGTVQFKCDLLEESAQLEEAVNSHQLNFDWLTNRVIHTHKYTPKCTIKELIAKAKSYDGQAEQRLDTLRHLGLVHMKTALESCDVVQMAKLETVIRGSSSYQRVLTDNHWLIALVMAVLGISPGLLAELKEEWEFEVSSSTTHIMHIINLYFHVTETGLSDMDVTGPKLAGPVTLLSGLMDEYAVDTWKHPNNQQRVVWWRILTRLVIDEKVVECAKLSQAVGAKLKFCIESIPEDKVDNFFQRLTKIGTDGLKSSQWAKIIQSIIIDPNQSILQKGFDEWVLHIVCELLLSSDIELKDTVNRYEYCLREVCSLISLDRPTQAYTFILLINLAVPSYYRLTQCNDEKLGLFRHCISSVQQIVEAKKMERVDLMQLCEYLISVGKSYHLLLQHNQTQQQHNTTIDVEP